MRSILRSRVLSAAGPMVLWAVSTMLVSAIAAQDQTSSESKEPASTGAAQAAVDRYQVPEGDVERLLEFISALQPRNFNPTTADEILEYRQRAPQALRTAAERILDLEKDRQSPAVRTAMTTLLSFRISKLPESQPEQQEIIFGELHEYLTTLEQMSRDELSLAFTTANVLEQTGNTRLAIEAYTTFGKLFGEQEDELLRNYGKTMKGVARRINLLGNEMQIEGCQTVDGRPFRWADYRDKVVLVDFWATWCGPCIAELPNVVKNYEQYHDRGFEVVGISLDTDREKLETFLEERQVPWVTLFQDGAGWEHPVATYYGVMGIPTVILVDKEGKVISLNARGPELGDHLARLLGPSE